ncbi:MAG: hypothetical protein ABH851_01970 [Methanobacteriota archaeon]
MVFRRRKRQSSPEGSKIPVEQPGVGQVTPELTVEERRRRFALWLNENESNPDLRGDVADFRRLTSDSHNLNTTLDRASDLEFQARVVENPAIVRQELKQYLENPVDEQQVVRQFASQDNSFNPSSMIGGSLGLISAYGIMTYLINSLKASGSVLFNPDFSIFAVPSLLLLMSPYLLFPAGYLVGSYIHERRQMKKIRESFRETTLNSPEYKSTDALLGMVDNVCKGAEVVGVGDRIPQERATGIKTSLLDQEITTGNQRLSGLGRKHKEIEKTLMEKAGLS